MSEAGKPGIGQQEPADSGSKFNVNDFHIQQQLGLVRTMELVKVVAVTNNGELAIAGSVDVLPLVNLLDGQGNASEHITVYELPYTRAQGGTNAVIMDPKVGDIGWAAIPARDISSVKAAKGQANPGSYRRFSLSDGVYVGGILNGVPVQYIQFTDNGIKIADKSGNIIQTSEDGIALTDSKGNVLVTGASGLTYNGVNIGDTHKHTEVQSGGDLSGPPQS